MTVSEVVGIAGLQNERPCCQIRSPMVSLQIS